MISNRYLGRAERYPPSLDLDRRYVDLQLSRLRRLYPSRMTRAYPAGPVCAAHPEARRSRSRSLRHLARPRRGGPGSRRPILRFPPRDIAAEVGRGPTMRP
jgi:hypothetical protein